MAKVKDIVTVSDHSQPLPGFTQAKANAQAIYDSLDVSENTRQDYKTRIQSFLEFIKDQEVNHNLFLEYKRSLAQHSDLSVATKNKYLAAARIFLKEVCRRGMLPTDITQNIKGFRQDKKHKRDGLNNDEIITLVEKLNSLPHTPRTDRIKAIIVLLTLQGLRQVEIIRLNISDIDLVGKRAFIQGKGRDDKEPVDLHPETVRLLKEYMGSNNVKDGALFTSRSNNSRNLRITTRSIRSIAKTLLNDLGIDKTVHGFRHYFITTLVDKFGGNLLDVAQYSRHRSLEMLQIYYDRVRKQHDLPKYYKAFEKVSF